MSSLQNAIRIDDDEDEDDSVVDLTNGNHTQKLKHDESFSNSKKYPLKSCQSNAIIPFQLYDTKMSIASSRSAPRHESTKQYFRTLRQTIGFDFPPGSSPKKREFQYLIICNYCIDIHYFLQETLPEILSFKRVVVFYGDAGLDNGREGMDRWREMLRGSGNTVEFVRLVPSDPPRSTTNPLDIKIPCECNFWNFDNYSQANILLLCYRCLDVEPFLIIEKDGVHHTKMFLVGYDEKQQRANNSGLGCSQSMIRVVVHTANLMQQDIEWKSQGLYSQDFPLKSENIDVVSSSMQKLQQTQTDQPLAAAAKKRGWPFEDEDPQQFEEDLVTYIESYRYSTRQSWCTSQQYTPGGIYSQSTLTDKDMSLVNLIRQYDYSSAYAVLIPSVPGKHSVSRADNFGYLKLRKAIRETLCSHCRHRGPTKVRNANNKPSAQQTRFPIICQFSSMGSLSSKWLNDFISAIDAHGSNDVQAKDKKSGISLENKVRIVWPTVEEIRNSIEGYRGGGSVPATSKNVNKDFLLPLYHRWSTRGVSESAGIHKNADPLGTSKVVPHIKTFVQLSQPANDDPTVIEWLCLTSHNLSKAAWGEIQNSTGFNSKVLFIRHWELGVFLSPGTLAKHVIGTNGDCKCCCIRLRPYTRSIVSGDPIHEDVKEDIVDITVPLPYDVINPVKYSDTDVPWTIDGGGKLLQDEFGIVGGFEMHSS
ncbi:hypothetical protein ACHAW6_007105 [Cyclotella cf. meneghiniana]